MSAQPSGVPLARRAPHLLQVFNTAGVLAPADVHVATRLGRLGGETDQRVLLAAALAVRAVRTGSVCIELATVAATVTGDEDALIDVTALPWPAQRGWVAACQASPLVAVGADGDPWRPLRLVDGLLYLDRYWRQEQLVRAELDGRARRPAGDVDEAVLVTALRRLFPGRAPDRQRLAAAVSAVRPVTVLAGGPGTGKTTTVARLLALLHALPGPPLRVALAAPTARAAARLQEAVRGVTGELPAEDQARIGAPTGTTVHRLLGWRPDSRSRFRHDRTNRLPHDLVVVDETSMVSLTLMARLLEALRPDARLVLVGDPDQLASVEAGAVLGDLVARPPATDELPALLARVAAPDLPTDPRDLAALRNGVVRLNVVHRFGPAISALAEAIRDGAVDRALDVLRGGHPSVEFVETATLGERQPEGLAGLRADVVTAATGLIRAARAGDPAAALRRLGSHRLLCAHRRGAYGVSRWSAEIERWIDDCDPGAAGEGEWYRGRPLLVTANDYEARLFNGDAGVVVDDGAGGVVAVFGRAEEPVRVSPSRLADVETMHATTVHRGQGSQFDRVSVVLPPPESPLLTRELLYTAVTRAKERVRILGTEQAVRAAVARPVRRASGLRRRVG